MATRDPLKHPGVIVAVMICMLVFITAVLGLAALFKLKVSRVSQRGNDEVGGAANTGADRNQIGFDRVALSGKAVFNMDSPDSRL